jgi:hypothetical protein
MGVNLFTLRLEEPASVLHGGPRGVVEDDEATVAHLRQVGFQRIKESG